MERTCPSAAAFSKSVRRTMVGFWDESHWINGLLMHYAMQANREIWNFEHLVDQRSAVRDLQRKLLLHLAHGRVGQPYGPLSPAHWIRLNRKLSVTVNLSDPDAYSGGDVQLKDRVGNPIAIEGMREQGTVLVFPSNVAHTVTPVTSGVRNSLAGWVLGPSFR